MKIIFYVFLYIKSVLFNDNDSQCDNETTNPQPVADFQAMSSLETYTKQVNLQQACAGRLVVNKYTIVLAQFASYKTLPLGDDYKRRLLQV